MTTAPILPLNAALPATPAPVTRKRLLELLAEGEQLAALMRKRIEPMHGITAADLATVMR